MAPQPLKGKFKEPVYHFDQAPVDTFEESLVISPEKAMAAVQHMQEKMRKQRAMSEMKLALMKNRLEGKIEHLEKQMSSNKDLWEALTME